MPPVYEKINEIVTKKIHERNKFFILKSFLMNTLKMKKIKMRNTQIIFCGAKIFQEAAKKNKNKYDSIYKYLK